MDKSIRTIIDRTWNPVFSGNGPAQQVYSTKMGSVYNFEGLQQKIQKLNLDPEDLYWDDFSFVFYESSYSSMLEKFTAFFSAIGITEQRKSFRHAGSPRSIPEHSKNNISKLKRRAHHHATIREEAYTYKRGLRYIRG